MTQANEVSKAAAARARALRLSSVIGVAAAIVIAVLVNMLAARHYRRFDWTSAGLYTLSHRTVTTLHGLAEPLSVYVLMSSADPLTMTLRHLLTAYAAETDRLVVRYVDPDRRPAEFLAVHQRFGTLGEVQEGGRLTTEAAVIVSRGDRHHFLRHGDMLRVTDADDTGARPQIEQALTGAIRDVLAGERARVCFTTGHGEPSLEDGAATGLASLHRRLETNNHDVSSLPKIADLEGADPIDACDVVVIAGPLRPLAEADVLRIKRRVEAGTGLLIAHSPVPDDTTRRPADLNLEPLLELAGVSIRGDFVFEQDPGRAPLDDWGETLIAEVVEHPGVDDLRRVQDQLPVILRLATSLVARPDAQATPSPLLRTSDDAFGLVDFYGWLEKQDEPRQGKADNAGPLVLAYASELPKHTAAAPHGPRIVVIGSASALLGGNWQADTFRGTALLVESALAWLMSRPGDLDIPAPSSQTAGMTMTQEARQSVFLGSVVFLPLATALLGVAVALRRRRGGGTVEVEGGPSAREGGEPGATE